MNSALAIPYFRPEAIELFGPLSIQPFGVLLAASFILASVVSQRYARQRGLDPKAFVDIVFWMALGGIVFGHLGHVFYEPRQYMANPLDIFKVWSGLSSFGGYFGCTAVAVWFFRSRGISPRRGGDLVMIGFMLGIFIGRLGCFAAGCCWGKPSDVGWAVQFPSRSMARKQHFDDGLLDGLLRSAEHPSLVESMPVHPVQLYDALGGLLLFGCLVWLRRRKRYHGQVFVWWLLFYPLMRGTMELFRGDTERGFVFRYISEPLNQLLGLPAGSVTFLSTSQFIGLGMALTALVVMYRLRRGLTARGGGA